MASKYFKNNKALHKYTHFSKKGNEIAFGTIGDASTSEGHFFETLNAAGVTQVPMVMSVWDDGWGISVPNSRQTTKSNLSEILKGFQKEKGTNGFELYRGNCSDYESLVLLYREGVEKTPEIQNFLLPIVFNRTINSEHSQGYENNKNREDYFSHNLNSLSFICVSVNIKRRHYTFVLP